MLRRVMTKGDRGIITDRVCGGEGVEPERVLKERYTELARRTRRRDKRNLRKEKTEK